MGSIEIVEHNPKWRRQYLKIAANLRSANSKNVIRIDHIGSTSVSGLASKDIIDIQVTVKNLDNGEHVRLFRDIGFKHRAGVISDILTGVAEDSIELRKQIFREPDGERRAHIHVREAGRLNQRYALLFRDYLRAELCVQQSYEIIKRQLAGIYPDDIDGYLSIKDPVMDIIYRSAEQWADGENWQPSADHD